MMLKYIFKTKTRKYIFTNICYRSLFFCLLYHSGESFHKKSSVRVKISHIKNKVFFIDSGLDIIHSVYLFMKVCKIYVYLYIFQPVLSKRCKWEALAQKKDDSNLCGKWIF